MELIKKVPSPTPNTINNRLYLTELSNTFHRFTNHGIDLQCHSDLVHLGTLLSVSDKIADIYPERTEKIDDIFWASLNRLLTSAKTIRKIVDDLNYGKQNINPYETRKTDREERIINLNLGILCEEMKNVLQKNPSL
jgi:hypothetical protein